MFDNLYHSLLQHLFSHQAPSLSMTPPAPQGQVNAPGMGMTMAPPVGPQINAPGPNMTMPQGQGFVNAPPGPMIQPHPLNFNPAPYYQPTVQSVLRNV